MSRWWCRHLSYRTTYANTHTFLYSLNIINNKQLNFLSLKSSCIWQKLNLLIPLWATCEDATWLISVSCQRQQVLPFSIFLSLHLPIPINLVFISSFYGAKVFSGVKASEYRRNKNIRRFGEPDITVLNVHLMVSFHRRVQFIVAHDYLMLSDKNLVKKSSSRWLVERVNPQLLVFTPHQHQTGDASNIFASLVAH